MPPRHQTLPAPQTSSAREAQKSFYCTLCSKGYSRMNDYEAHLSSYDHTHKQRLKDMKAMVRDPNAGARARRAEAKADGLISIKLTDKDKQSTSAATAKKPGFKRSGFKSAFASKDSQPAVADTKTAAKVEPTQPVPAKKDSSPDESSTEDEGYERYDPRYPTD
ncbi:zinc-finger double-stranded RNA-binding domain-containing protein [Hirsutella rhossiliensis]|uniref:Zinc-finger double-stranded RNA-binding domain-containing protein n=1 Tax=Hirsutella rhossiliensis TaxID=111463 RepID=A0A9P8SF17_9HYPO|nr:zinc-finger double-stranded RNA-binding domain-containing protein [Hirsutella rhossiliensis]KAH0958970.1 zinc-finger double-stranded RNA-binding domain-containing protein [Hirsutella rhossiliensis]